MRVGIALFLVRDVALEWLEEAELICICLRGLNHFLADKIACKRNRLLRINVAKLQTSGNFCSTHFAEWVRKKRKKRRFLFCR